MNTRPLTPDESANLAALNATGIHSALLFVTATGLHKSILDATEPMRSIFRESGVHDYAQQLKGQNHKVLKEAVILTDIGLKQAQLSLYRPVTKDGDPRMWFYGLKENAKPDDVFAIFVIAGRVHALNLTDVHLADSGVASPALTSFFAPLRYASQKIAEELLGLLRSLACKGPIRAVCKGNTAIGRSIEDALGISINSSRAPDYKGIELKSGRSTILSRETRATLFACVPNWNLSTLKSSEEILERYGYERGDQFKLYCSVSTLQPNSQGLQFRIEDALRWLREVAKREAEEQVAVWELSHLEQRLAEKHRETFWIKAKSEMRSDGEWFHLQSVTHTRNPNLPQFERLLAEGTVTMDHLIKRLSTGRAHEKGPLFKIKRQRIQELFLGQPAKYSLAA
jgi:hypothetical protein